MLHENYLRRHLLSPSGSKDFTTRVETTSGLQAHIVLLGGHFLFFCFFYKNSNDATRSLGVKYIILLKYNFFIENLKSSILIQ